MHEAFTLSEKLPVRPGESPFHVKGIFYTRTLEHAALVRGGLSALQAAIGDPEVNAFLSQKFTWNGWYDIFPMMPTSIALSRLRGQDYMELFHERGRLTATTEIPRIFRTLMSFASVRTQVQQIPLFASKMFDFSTVEELSATDNTATGRHRGVPAYVAPYIAATVGGFLRGAVELRTRKPAMVRTTTITKDVDQKGFPTLSMRYEAEF